LQLTAQLVDVGVIGNLHLFLEDIFPNSLGKPLFASAAGGFPSTEQH